MGHRQQPPATLKRNMIDLFVWLVIGCTVFRIKQQITLESHQSAVWRLKSEKAARKEIK